LPEVQRIADGEIILAATDVAEFLACPHLAQQRLAIVRGERGRPRPSDDPHAELIRIRGEEHEAEQLALLSVECGGHVDLTREFPQTREELESAAATTEAAMREGVPLIYQAQLFDGRWQGRTDFLRRIDAPSSLGEFSYEVLDTKLARAVKPPVIHQLSLYNRLVGRIQGSERPCANLLLGDGSMAVVTLGRYQALHRHVCARLEEAVAAPTVQTYPEPVAHCAICALADECYKRWVKDDHLSLVAFARRDHREELTESGLATVLELAHAPDGHPASGPLGEGRFGTLRRQAALQVDSRDSGDPVHHHLEPARAAGYALLPEPSAGDVFFDLEGDPYVADAGIEYLWGWWTSEDDYRHVWAHDQAAEKQALETFVDAVVELCGRYPDLHVYHYAPHEKSKLRSLAAQYATREQEVDQLLREEVFIDLYAIVRQGMQVGEDSYSLKKLERHHGFERLEKRVREGGGSIVAYEAWLESGDDELLEAIRAYNEEDCRSTASLRDWLQGTMLPEAAADYRVDFADLREADDAEEHVAPAWLPEVHWLISELEAVEDAERILLAHLLLYHYRESKPSWWRYFDLRGNSLTELLDDRDALAYLERDDSVAPTAYKKSHDYTFTFPAQEFRLDKGDAQDPTTGQGYKVVSVADAHIVLRWGSKEPPPPVALIAGSPINVTVLREALMELARSLIDGDGDFPAARALLRREPPRLSSGALGESGPELISAALGLECSALSIQGPPGTGKTYRAARMIVAALQNGLRVGITAPSHTAIQNLLCDVEDHAHELGFAFAGVYKGVDYESAHELVEVADGNDDVEHDHQLVAGTAWLFARPEHRRGFDLLFIDEAGQFALGSAAAVALATRSVILLGDPQQLPQVNQASHPGGSGASVLEHILDGQNTLAPDQGVLLTESWRMHPDVCRFVSERSYDGRLASRADCARRRVQATGSLSGVGLRCISVSHEGRSQSSPEEAEVIGGLCRELLDGATFADDRGRVHDLRGEHILVVAPYNLAVRTIRQHVPGGVRVGTVDKFQGQEAPVVFYAMSCSAGEDAPRGVDFLFDRHRFNVAVSRAQCLAVLIHSPRLLDTDCPSVETMELLDGICRFVEMARP
jgi:predicted RecB family nuclease